MVNDGNGGRGYEGPVAERIVRRGLLGRKLAGAFDRMGNDAGVAKDVSLVIWSGLLRVILSKA